MSGVGNNPANSASIRDATNITRYSRSAYTEDMTSDELHDQYSSAGEPSLTYSLPPLSYKNSRRPGNASYHPKCIPTRPRGASDGTDSQNEYILPITSSDGLHRYATRKVKLVQGTVLCVDYPVPSAVRNSVQPKYRDLEGGNGEFSTTRYTAATCDPNDFTLKNGYDLRPRLYRRHTELLVAVTCCNEDKVLLRRTTHSIMQNIRDITNLERSTFWNKRGPAWQNIVLCIVIDGVDLCDQGVLDTLATVGVFQQGVLKKEVNGKETVAHVFEYTTQLSVTPEQKIIRPVDDNPHTLRPVQTMLCLKARNSGKINSMRWVYNAFGRILNPEFVIHVDAGTKVFPNSILALWEAFYNGRKLGGATGLLSPMLGKWGKGLLNPLVAFQNFEYKTSFQLEQALASSTGYHSILPGAFSAYRFRAVMGRPLEEYFHGDPTLAKILGKKAASASLYRLNRFSTDNRVLPFEIVAKHGSNWHTRCVPAAVAETDVPTSVVDFIHQRRRWLNGSLAASTYNLRRSHRLISSGHTIPRMALISIQILHNLIAFVLAWFSLAGLLLTTFIVNDITGDPPDGIQVDGFPFGRSTPIINSIIQIIYLATIAVQFLVALGSRPRSHVLTYRISFSIFAVVQLYLFVNLIYLAKIIIDFKLDKIGSTNYAYISQYYTDIGDVTVLATAISFLGVYITAGFLCLDPWHLFHSWAQYLFVSSSYVNIVKTHAFSNFQDISWSHELGAEIVCVTPVSRGIQRIRDEAHEEIGPGPRNIDDEFEQTVKRALSPFKEKTIAAKGDPEEKFMNSRIKLVAVYVFSNFLLCLIVMNDSFRSLSWLGNSYWHRIWFFRIYLWANSGLLMLQFIGCVYQKAVGLFYCCVSQR